MPESPYDLNCLMRRIQELWLAAETAEPADRLLYLSLAAQCETLLARSLSTPAIAVTPRRHRGR